MKLGIVYGTPLRRSPLGLPYGKPKTLATRLTNDNLFVMEGMLILSMRVAKNKVEEIRWVYNQIIGIKNCTAEMAIIAPKSNKTAQDTGEKSYIC